MTTTRKMGNHRIYAVGLALAILLTSLALFPAGDTVVSAASLPYIEKLKTQLEGDTGRPFRILEVVSGEGETTSIGFYIAGKEPGNIANNSGVKALTSVTDREGYANDWVTTSNTKLTGIVGSDEAANPFNIVAYDEGFWWENDTMYPNELTLDHEETANGEQGTITPNPGGQYKAQSSYTIGISGDYVLQGGHLREVTAAPGDTEPHFYYLGSALDFEMLTSGSDDFASGNPIPDGTAIYVADGGSYEFEVYKSPGVLGFSDYYAVEVMGKAFSVDFTAAKDEALTLGSSGVYELVDYKLIPSADGYISHEITGLTLVETGGDYDFTPDTTGKLYDITYNKVRYSGGFVNHNWFSRYVLDVEATEAGKIAYDIVTHTADELAGVKLGDYDLVVIGANVSEAATGIIGLAAADEVKNGTLPVLFVFAEKPMAALFNADGVYDLHDGEFVVDNLYFYQPDGREDLLNKDFHKDFDTTKPGFAVVSDNINSENDLRAITGAPLLPVEVSVATSIRHILNQREPRAVKPLSQVRVLEIQPLNVKGHDDSAGGHLTENMVVEWLDGLKITPTTGDTTPRDIVAEDVTITRMSTAEFNGKIEDLNESYELIYIGDSRAYFAGFTGKPLDGGQTDFDDINMDGLLYYNIGDKITKTEGATDWHAPTKAAGLLNSDWTGSDRTGQIKAGVADSSRNYRLPGNDISPSKKKALEDFVSAGYPIVFAGDLVKKDTSSVLQDVTYDVVITRNGGTAQLTAAVSFQDGTTSYSDIEALKAANSNTSGVAGVYEWHWVDGKGVDRVVGTGTESYTIDNTKAASTYAGEYYCVYRLNNGGKPLGTTARSNSLEVVGTATYLQVSGHPEKTVTSSDGMVRTQLTVSASPVKPTTDNITITAAIAITDTAGNPLTSVTTSGYTWYQVGTLASIDSGDSLSVDSAGEYYCKVTVDGTVITSQTIQIASSQKSFSIDPGVGSPQKGVVSSYKPDEDRVDKWTNLSDFMLDALRRENVFAVEELEPATLRNDSLRSFIAISKPEIVLTAWPTDYKNDGGSMTSNSTGRQLEYKFEISDPADPTPAATTYHVRLYVDANASGLYTADEAVSIDVYDGGKLLNTSGTGRLYALRADTEYRLVARLPVDMVGIVPWKLEVVKNSADGKTARYFHGSETGYTRIAPESGQEKQIKVLQIVGVDSYHKDNISYPDDGITVVLEGNDMYAEYLELKDFDIRLNTIMHDGSFYRYDRDPAEEPLIPESCVEGATELWLAGDSVDTIFSKINYYDMLVIGFADCYYDVGENLAEAIAKYIDSGKAVLFTHDTTSYLNVPKDTVNTDVPGRPSWQDTESDTAGAYWGYHFNTVLRSRLGLDYYGIMDEDSSGGLSSLAEALRKQTTSGNHITSSQISDLKAKGYNIAYKPKVGGMDPNTQGYTTYFLHTDDPGYRPEKVTQLNVGQITTYPYNINLEGFQGAPSGAASSLDVAPTHFQYYSLNMNIEDMVVWYCLADDDGVEAFSELDSFYYHTNDASNGYYIYTMGNVTYSGMGHDYNVTEEEAKLFVNTMIAAYRSTSFNSDVSICDRNNAEISYIYFPADMAEAADTMLVDDGTGESEARAVYFSFVDANVQGGNTGISYARYYYSIGDTVKDLKEATLMENLPTYLDGSAVDTIARNNLYHFYLPTAVVNQLSNSHALRVYIEVVTHFDNGTVGRGSDSVEVRKIGLLALE